ncbi:MAG: nucleotidyltransferase domain-containing protein [Thermodesulfovibrionales bacterium]
MKKILEKPQSHVFLSAPERDFLDKLIKKITTHFSFIKKIYLYGSKARGDFTEESDLDLLFVTDRPVLREEKFEVYDIMFEFEVEYGVSASAIFVSISDIIEKRSSFLRDIEGEKVLLWSRE